MKSAMWGCKRGWRLFILSSTCSLPVRVSSSLVCWGNPSSGHLRKEAGLPHPSGMLPPSSALRSNAVFSLSEQSLPGGPLSAPADAVSPQRQHLTAFSLCLAPRAAHSAYPAAYLGSSSGLLTFLQFSCFSRLKLSKKKKNKKTSLI